MYILYMYIVYSYRNDYRFTLVTIVMSLGLPYGDDHMEMPTLRCPQGCPQRCPYSCPQRYPHSC